MLGRFTPYRAQLRLTARVVIGAVLAYGIATAFSLPQGYWSVITALIVIQGSLGATLASGMDRMIGTLLGAAVGAGVGFAGAALGLPFLIRLTLAITPLAFVTAMWPTYRIAAVTAVIVLLDAGTGSSIEPALHRVAEIALGTAVGILVSLVVYPSRAGKIALERGAATLARLGELSALFLRGPAVPQSQIDLANDRIRAELARVVAAATEARREHATRMAGAPVPGRLVRVLRRLHSDVLFIGRATRGDSPAGVCGTLAGPIGEFEVILPELLSACGRGLTETAVLPTLDALDAAIEALGGAVDAAGSGATRDAVALLFATETLRRDIGDFLSELQRLRPGTARQAGPGPG